MRFAGRPGLRALAACFFLLCLVPPIVFGQAAPAADASYFKYQKIMVPMRDGVKLETVILTPRNQQGPLHVRRPAQPVKQALPQMLRTWPLAAPQGMARRQNPVLLPRREEVKTMAVSLPLWLLIGALVYLAWRHLGLKVWHLLACVVLGVLLAATPAGPVITNALSEIVRWSVRQ